MIIILKNKLWSFKHEFFYQNHGRSNKLPVKIIIFFFDGIHNCIGLIKQIMTGPSGNRLSICTLRFASPKMFINLGCVQSIETLGEAILNPLGQIDRDYYPRD